MVAVRDGVHVVAQGVHDARLGGAEAHDLAAFAVHAHVQSRIEGIRTQEVEAACEVGWLLQGYPGSRECGGDGCAVVRGGAVAGVEVDARW